MELAALVVVNVVTGFVMYILFSMRYTRAIKKRDQGIVDSMRSIADETRKTSVDILDLVQQKQESIYLLTRRAEELLEELKQIESSPLPKKRTRKIPQKPIEPASTASKKQQKKSVKKKTASRRGKQPVVPKSKTPTLNEGKARASYRQSLEAFDASSNDELKQNDIYFERALASQRDDQYDILENAIDTKEAFEKGRLTKSDGGQYASIQNQSYQVGSDTIDQIDPPTSNFLSTLGRFAKKVMGVPTSEPVLISTASDSAEVRTDHPLEEKPSFEQMLKEPKKAKVDLLPRIDRWVPSDSVKPVVQDKVSISSQSELFPLYSATVPMNPKPDHPEQKESLDQATSHATQDFTHEEGRVAAIRIMIDAGFSLDEIQKKTQATRAEMDLILKFPLSKKPKKFAHTI